MFGLTLHKYVKKQYVYKGFLKASNKQVWSVKYIQQKLKGK